MIIYEKKFIQIVRPRNMSHSIRKTEVMALNLI